MWGQEGSKAQKIWFSELCPASADWALGFGICLQLRVCFLPLIVIG